LLVSAGIYSAALLLLAPLVPAVALELSSNGSNPIAYFHVGDTDPLEEGATRRERRYLGTCKRCRICHPGLEYSGFATTPLFSHRYVRTGRVLDVDHGCVWWLDIG